VDVQRSEFLPYEVMQLVGERPPLRFLRLDQSPGDGPQSIRVPA
jgi:hypothetical protein